MGKTYEALKRAEAERKAKAARDSKSESERTASVAAGEPPADVKVAPAEETASPAQAERRALEPEISTERPAEETASPINLPTPAERRWFRFRRRASEHGSGNGGNGNGYHFGNGNGNGHRNGNGNGHRNGNGYRNGNGNGHRNGNGNGNGHGYRSFTFDVPPTTIEEFQQLRKNIMATKAPRSLQLMLLVSSRHGEGATTTTALLGSTMSQGGRCLLIDANFRTPGLSRIFGGEASGGLCEALADGGASAEHYHPTEIPNLYFMPTGQGPTRVPYMFEGRALDDLVTGLRREFDCILIDGAPMEMYADSSYIAPRADGVILVVQAEATPIGASAISLRELERVGAHVLGAVLNRTQNYIPELFARLTNPQELIEVAVVPAPEEAR